jgi:hypothetical protein
MRVVGTIFLVVWSIWLFGESAFAITRCDRGYEADGKRCVKPLREKVETQVMCNRQGCRPVKPGCHIKLRTIGGQRAQSDDDIEICP